MSLTQYHLYKILSLVHLETVDEKPSPAEFLDLPIWHLRGLSEEEGSILEDVMDFQTIEDLVNCTFSAEEVASKTRIPKYKIDRWFGMSRILRSLTSGDFTTPKVVLVGLDNAGKTSIILTMKRIADQVSQEARMNEILKLKPTKGVERQEVVLQGQPMLLFDFGGQKAYRRRYLDSPQRYLEAIDLVIFVLDVKDEERFPEALIYFEGLAKEIKNLELSPAFAIFFHKLDEVLPEDSETWQKLLDQASLFEAVLRSIWKDKALLSLDKDMLFQTSIRREISVFSGVSNSLKCISPVQDILRGGTRETAEYLDSDLLLLIADNGLELARFQSETADYLKDLTPTFLFKETLQKIPEMEDDSIVYPIQIAEEQLFHVIITTTVEEKPIYLSYLSRENKIPHKYETQGIIGETFLPWVANYFEEL